jgi:uncharacterized cupin superfamily protein
MNVHAGESAIIKPVRLATAMAGGAQLDLMNPWPAEMVVKGVEPSRYKTWFEGQISAMVYAPKTGMLRFSGTSYDEFVVVLHGHAILTADEASPERFTQGDAFVVPQGFRGTWEFHDEYRELIVFETRALQAVMKAWDLSPQVREP